MHRLHPAAVAVVAALAGCTNPAFDPPAADTALEPFAPLAGTWRAAVAKPGDRISWTEETWSAPAGASMMGMSRTLGRGDWSAGEFEFLRIVSRPDGVFYLASPGGRTPPTEFRYQPLRGKPGASTDVVFALLGAPSLRFVNEAHDFPQSIVYELESNNEMRVTIAGPGGLDGAANQSRTWHFERVK